MNASPSSRILLPYVSPPAIRRRPFGVGPRRLALLVVAGAMHLAAARGVGAQDRECCIRGDFSLRGSFGVADGTLGGTGTLHGVEPGLEPGLVGTVSIDAHLGQHWSLRFQGETFRLGGPAAAPGMTPVRPFQEDLRTLGVSLNAVRRLSDGQVAPYILGGLGVYRLRRVRSNSITSSDAYQAGGGLDLHRWQRVKPFAELRGQLFMSDRETLTTRMLMVGARLR